MRRFDGVVPKASWGETSLFYNPGQALPNGVYFCTIKEKDGANDKASQLDRCDVFRLSVGIGREAYEKQFGARPKRPVKGGIITAEYDFSAVNTLMPHPIYGWMSWVQILNPSEEALTELLPFIDRAYTEAAIKFNKKVRQAQA